YQTHLELQAAEPIKHGCSRLALSRRWKRRQSAVATSKADAACTFGASSGMSLGMPTVEPANPPTEYPDIVGARPTNPLAANFKPFIPASVRLPELTPAPLIIGTLLGVVFG